MIYTIWYKLVSSYKAFIGSGTLLGLFVVALAVLVILDVRKNKKGIPYTFVLSIWGAIGYVAAYVYGVMEKIDIDSKAKKTLLKAATVVLIFYIAAMSGDRIINNEYMTKADNQMHIDSELKESMDIILNDSIGEVGILTMPGYSNYFTAYSSRFRLAYEEPKQGDVTDYSEVDRESYVELCDKFPDMRKVAKAARQSECRYIVIENNSYWPEISLDELGYSVIASAGKYNIYRNNLGVD